MVFRKTRQAFSIPRSILLLAAASAAAAFVSVQAATITVDPGTVLLTMRGWEAQGHAAEHFANFSTFVDDVMTMAADVGINRVRLEVYSGDENPVDNWAIYRAAGKPDTGPAKVAWNATRYEAINDDNTPNHIATSGFHFSQLDDNVDQIVNPLRAKVAARGESLYVNLCYVAFTNQITSGIYVHQSPAEYAEFLLATFQHLQATYGWVPNAVEAILEPENSNIWSATAGSLIGQAIKAAGDRLAAAGFHPDFIAPSVTNNDNGPAYIDHISQVSGAMPYVKEFSYHRYGGTSVAAMASKAVAFGVGASMLEWWDAGMTYATLHDDLTRGRNSAWQQGALAVGPSAFGVTVVSPTNAAVTKNTITGYTQQYFRYVRFGATRIAASSSDGTFDPLAFVNPTGAYTVVVKATGGGTFAVQGLPAGTYRTRYTTASEVDAAAPDQTIGAGQPVNAAIPAAGVIVVFGVSGQAAPPGPFAKTSPANGATGLSSSATLSWTASSGATSYAYCLDTTNNGACDAAWVSAGSGTSAAVSGLAAGTNYFWQIRATNAAGQTTYADGSSAAFVSFSTQGSAPGSFGKTGPSSGSTGLGTSLSLGWTASAGATSYEYCVDTANNGVCDASWIPVGSSLGTGLGGLLLNTTYYWQVRASNATGVLAYADGGAGVFWNFKTLASSPGAFNKSAPAGGSTVATSLTLAWAASADAVEYQYCLDTVNNSVCDGTWVSVGASLGAGVGGLVPNTTYYWQVRAHNAIGAVMYADDSASAFASFTTQTGPGEFSKVSPTTGATGFSNNLTLTWNASTGATAYEYCIDTVNNASCDATWIANGAALNVALSSLSFSTTYYWQVRATNATSTPTYADGASGTFWSFQTTAAQQAQLTTPAPGSTLASDTVTFEWTGGLGVTQYWLQVGSTTGGADIANINTGTALSATVSTLPTDGRLLFVRLQSLINGVWQFNDYTLTAERVFTIQKAELVSPAPHSTLTASTVSFEWTGGSGATAYRLSVGTASGTTDLFDSDAGTNLSIVVSGLPNDGRPLFVRLWSQFEGSSEFNDYEFTATTQVLRKAELTTPAPGSSLRSSTVTFEWNGGIGVTATQLSVGTAAGAADLFDRDVTAEVEAVVDNLPTDGRTLFVRLWSLVGGVWQWNDSTLTAATIVAPVLAELVSPAAGSTLTESTVTFEWTGGTGVSAYWLSIGNEPGGSDLATVDATSSLSATVTGLPADGRTLSVRLFSLIGETWRHNDYVLTAATIAAARAAELIHPAPESTLTAAGISFEWTGGAGVSAYRLTIGTSPGASDLADHDAQTSLKATVGGLPIDGRTIFVRLWSLIAGSWQFRDYTFHAMSVLTSRPAELLNPAAGSRLESTTVQFRWSGGSGVSHYKLTIGTTPGSDDIASMNAETVLSAFVPGLPSDGRLIYVRLYSFMPGGWEYRDYVLTAVGGDR